MKKFLTTLMALMVLSSTAVYASETPVSDWINSKTSKITKREQSASAKAAAERKRHQEKIAKQQAKQAEMRKKREAKVAKQRQKAALRRAEQQKRANAHKQRVQTKKKQFKEFFTFD